jgi:hypothetical protein
MQKTQQLSRFLIVFLPHITFHINHAITYQTKPTISLDFTLLSSIPSMYSPSSLVVEWYGMWYCTYVVKRHDIPMMCCTNTKCRTAQ